MELARFSLTTTRCHLGFVYFVQHQETTRADRGVCLVARAALWSLFITIVVANAQMNILKASYSHCNYPSDCTSQRPVTDRSHRTDYSTTEYDVRLYGSKIPRRSLATREQGLAAPEAMTELLLPALRLSDPASLIDARQRSPIPESSRLSRIRAFALTTGAPSPSSTQSQRPVLAKDILDGDVPVTAFSSRSAFGDADQLHRVSLFTDTDHIAAGGQHGDLAERSHILQTIDQKVAKMMRLHIMTRPSWGASSSPQKNPARRSLSPPGLGLAVQPRGPTESSSESAHDPDSSSSWAESPPPDFDNEVTNVTNHRQQAGAKKLVTACLCDARLLRANGLLEPGCLPRV